MEVQNDLDRIESTLDNLSETAKTLSVEAGSGNPPQDLPNRIGTLQKALDGLRSDVQELRESLG